MAQLFLWRRRFGTSSGLAVSALLVLSIAGGCQQIRDGGPHPEPPARVPDESGDAGLGGPAGAGGESGANAGGAGGFGGQCESGAGGEDPPVCEMDAGVFDDAAVVDEDAGPLR